MGSIILHASSVCFFDCSKLVEVSGSRCGENEALSGIVLLTGGLLHVDLRSCIWIDYPFGRWILDSTPRTIIRGFSAANACGRNGKIVCAEMHHRGCKSKHSFLGESFDRNWQPVGRESSMAGFPKKSAYQYEYNKMVFWLFLVVCFDFAGLILLRDDNRSFAQ